jgi:protein-tyrosine kinase
MRKELITFRNPKSPISETFRTLRTNIQFMNINRKLKSILITSTLPGEGKSWVASNLAITFAQAEKKVILIDADMRKGRQYSIFGISPRPGLANYLAASDKNADLIDMEKYVQKTEIDGLYVISAGNVPPNPSELLITPQMQRLLDRLSTQFDIIIVDAPPCELVTDAVILSRMVDSTVIVTAHKFTKKASLQKTIKSIKNVGGKIAGVVLNKVPIDAKKYEKSYYYGSQLTTTRGKREAGRAVSKKDFFEEEHKKPVEDKVKIEKEVVKNEKPEEPKQNEKVENDMPDKTQEIFRQVNEYLQQERNNLNDTKRDN